MRKLHLVELVTALNGADEVFDHIRGFYDVTPHLEAAPDLHIVVFQALRDGQAISALSVINMSNGYPVLAELIVS